MPKKSRPRSRRQKKIYQFIFNPKVKLGFHFMFGANGRLSVFVLNLSTFGFATYNHTIKYSTKNKTQNTMKKQYYDFYIKARYAYQDQTKKKRLLCLSFDENRCEKVR